MRTRFVGEIYESSDCQTLLVKVNKVVLEKHDKRVNIDDRFIKCL